MIRKKSEGESEARNKLAERFEKMGAKVAAWILREGYSTEAVAIVATGEIGEQKVYEAGGSCASEALNFKQPNDYKNALFNLGSSIEFGALHGRPHEAKQFLDRFKKEYLNKQEK